MPIHKSEQIKTIMLVFLFLLFLQYDILYQLPVWDTAMSVFPAALTLVDLDFDIQALRSMPVYMEGGPRAHSNSIITIFTSFIIKALGGNNAFIIPILHLSHLLIAAIGLYYFYLFCLPVFGKLKSALLALSLLFSPFFLVQTGYLYLEMPLFTFTILSIYLWGTAKKKSAIFFATLACLTKETGLITVVTLASLCCLDTGKIKKKLLFIMN